MKKFLGWCILAISAAGTFAYIGYTVVVLDSEPNFGDGLLILTWWGLCYGIGRVVLGENWMDDL
jgi:hypothetical protein